jgi:hypothetical protein
MLAFFLTHWFQYYFVPVHEVWWKGAVWGNVFAVLPLAVLGAVAFFYHRAEVKALHESHDKHLRAILQALDPEAESESMLDQIADRVSEETPGGIRTVLEAIEGKERPKARSK